MARALQHALTASLVTSRRCRSSWPRPVTARLQREVTLTCVGRWARGELVRLGRTAAPITRAPHAVLASPLAHNQPTHRNGRQAGQLRGWNPCVKKIALIRHDFGRCWCLNGGRSDTEACARAVPSGQVLVDPVPAKPRPFGADRIVNLLPFNEGAPGNGHRRTSSRKHLRAERL